MEIILRIFDKKEGDKVVQMKFPGRWNRRGKGIRLPDAVGN